MKKIRQVTGVLIILVVLLAAGCTAAESEARAGNVEVTPEGAVGGGVIRPDGTAVVDDSTGLSNGGPGGSEPDLPRFYLLTESALVEGMVGSFCWANTCVDLDFRPPIEYFAPLKAGEPIRLQLEEPLPEMLYLGLSPGYESSPGSGGSTEFVPADLMITWAPQVAPGDYLLTAQGRWDGGSSDVTYYFGVSVLGSGDGSSTGNAVASGVEGWVLIGPMCPVVREGEECPDQPYQATITILDQSGQVVVQLVTDEMGHFLADLAPGTYVLHPESPGPGIPRAGDQTITLAEGQIVPVTIVYDSGIR